MGKFEILINNSFNKRFMPYDFIIDKYNKISLKDYQSAFTGTLKNPSADNYENLNTVYHIFNVEHPENYKNRSLSVGDLVKLNDEFYYVDSIGFKNVTDTIKG